MPRDQHRFVTIEGAIAVGKTTLARLLGEPLSAELLLEVFEENPFLSDFYADPERFAFQTQIFFLLSRYRQQHRVVRQTLQRHTLISDYFFDKDALFARLNLQGSELEMYQRVQSILGESIPEPDLVVFLRADTDILMQRIANRDRAYERSISRQYIDQLRMAYEQYFATYTAAPVLTIDTNRLNIVEDLDARARVIGQVREALDRGLFQQPLPDLEKAGMEDLDGVTSTRRRICDLQRWHQVTDPSQDTLSGASIGYISLSESLGSVAKVLKSVLSLEEAIADRVGNRQEALDRALQEHSTDLQHELAECLVDLLRFANCVGVDMESAYMAKIGGDPSAGW